MQQTIRDGLYGYIPLTELERDLVGSPEALRLNRILQNSSLYLTYPNNRTSRFSHSIGAMHVAGLLFKALARSDGWLEPLQPQVEALLAKHRCKLEAIQQAIDDDVVQLTGYPKSDWIKIVLFQGVRLAALLHDIGHPPYSHIVERAVADAIVADFHPELKQARSKLAEKYVEITGPNKGADLHEMLGVVVADGIFTDVNAKHPNYYRLVCFDAAAAILSADQLGHYQELRAADIEVGRERSAKLLPWYPLGQLVSGEIDCDRLDYLRRDPRATGVSDFGHFDLHRIVDSICAVDYQPDGGDESFFIPGFDHRCISALESFFFDRLRQFRWLVNHHSVIRSDSALGRAIYRLLQVSANPAHQLYDAVVRQQRFNDLWRCWPTERTRSSFHRIDDVWLERLLLNVHDAARAIEEPDRSEETRDVELLLDVFLYRRKERLRSLWKRLDEFTHFADGFLSFFVEKYAGTGPSVRPSDPELRDRLVRMLKRAADKSKPPKSFLSTRFVNEVFVHLNRTKIRTDGRIPVLLGIERELDDGRFMLEFKPFKPYRGVLIVADGGTVDLKQMSSLVSSLDRLWRDGLSCYVYDRRPSGRKMTPNEVSSLGYRVGRIIDERLFTREASAPTRGDGAGADVK